MVKMKEIYSEYIINEETLALIPAKGNAYRTIVLTTTGELYIKQTPLKIVDKSCLREYTSYEGRRKAVTYLTGFKMKVPIPINTSLNIYGFPTMSPRRYDCIWLFNQHIRHIEDNGKRVTSDKTIQSTVHFINGVELALEVSSNSLQHQRFRTAMCKNIFDSDKRIS